VSARLSTASPARHTRMMGQGSGTMELTDDVRTGMLSCDILTHHEEGRVAAYGEVGKDTSTSGTLGVGPPQYCLPSAARPYDGPGLKYNGAYRRRAYEAACARSLRAGMHSGIGRRHCFQWKWQRLSASCTPGGATCTCCSRHVRTHRHQVAATGHLQALRATTLPGQRAGSLAQTLQMARK